MPAVWDATLEEVKAALDSKESARNNAQLVRAIEAASDSIENDQLHRRFYPEIDTRSFDWPSHVDPRDGSRTVPLGPDELVSYTEVRVEGVVVDGEHVTLLPVNDGPPYTGIELDSTITLSGDTGRRAIEITGVFGFWDREAPAGTLAAAVADDTVDTITVSDSAEIGTGQLVLIGAERMIVTRRTMVDTTQNLGTSLTASTSNETVTVGSGAAFSEGETILIDAEKMLIVEIAGNNLVVKRAWDGSSLAAHTAPADVYAPRLLTVRREQLGTTGAAHSQGAAITKHVVPKLVNQLCIAEALTAYLQENSGYGREIGSGDAEQPAPGAGLEDLRRRTWEAYGRTVFGPSTWNADDGL